MPCSSASAAMAVPHHTGTRNAELEGWVAQGVWIPGPHALTVQLEEPLNVQFPLTRPNIQSKRTSQFHVTICPHRHSIFPQHASFRQFNHLGQMAQMHTWVSSTESRRHARQTAEKALVVQIADGPETGITPDERGARSQTLRSGLEST